MKYEKEAVLKQFLLPSQIHNKYSVATVLFPLIFSFRLTHCLEVATAAIRSSNSERQD